MRANNTSKRKTKAAKAPKLTKKQTSAIEQAYNILDNNDWRDGYQFRSSNWLYLHDPIVRIDKKKICVDYRVMYKTKQHKVYKDMRWIYDVDNIKHLNHDICNLENVICNTVGDDTDPSNIFGKRFNKAKFFEKEYDKKGWVILK